MKKPVFLLLSLLALVLSAQARTSQTDAADLARWQKQAANVTITRDDWGIAHVKGKTDADAVFGATGGVDNFNILDGAGTQIIIESLNATFEDTTFDEPVTSLRINAGDGADTIRFDLLTFTAQV